MNILFLIFGIVLILMSFVLLILSPAALIGILAGVLIILFRKKIVAYCISSSEISKNILKDHQEKRRTEREANNTAGPIVRNFNFVEHIPISDVSADAITPFLVGEENIDRENVMFFERGDKIFRNIYSFDAAIISVSGKDVLVNGNPFAHLLPKNLEKYELIISEHPDSWLSLDVSFGHYAEIVRNPDYDCEFDDESERNMVEYDCLDEPRATLSIHYTTERSYS